MTKASTHGGPRRSKPTTNGEWIRTDKARKIYQHIDGATVAYDAADRGCEATCRCR